MMNTQNITCRECENDLDLADTCEDHEAELEDEISQYKTVSSIIKSIDLSLIVDLIDCNGLEYLIDDYVASSVDDNLYKSFDHKRHGRYKQLKKGMIKFAKKEGKDYLEEAQADYLAESHVGDDFRFFYFNKLFGDDELVEEYFI